MLVHEVRAFVLSAVAGLSLEHARERQLIDRAPAVPVGSYLLRPTGYAPVQHAYIRAALFRVEGVVSEPRRESVLARSMANCHKIGGEPRALPLAERAVQLPRTLFFCFPIFLTRAVFLFPLVMPRTPRTHRRNAEKAATAERPQRDGTSPDRRTTPPSVLGCG